MCAAAFFIQAFMRARWRLAELARKHASAAVIQSTVRRVAGRRAARHRWRAARQLTALGRGSLARRAMQRSHAAAVLLQLHFRSRRRSERVTWQHVSAWAIGRVRNCKVARRRLAYSHTATQQ